MLNARIAKLSDRRRVARLCRRAVGPRDYVLDILTEVIKKRGLFLAFENGELVGMTNYERCIDGSGWLGVARTDPDWRGRGVAVFLQQQIARYARRRGVTSLRLWTYSKNKPAIRASLKGGFRRVGEFAHVSSSLGRVRKGAASAPTIRLSEDSTRTILDSMYLRKANGYLAHGWHVIKAGRPLLMEVVKRRQLYVVGQSAFILTEPERWGHKQYANFALLSGPAASSLRTIQAVAKSKGTDIVGAYLPYDRYLLRVSNRLGFRVDSWGKHCLIFEKNLQ